MTSLVCLISNVAHWYQDINLAARGLFTSLTLRSESPWDLFGRNGMVYPLANMVVISILTQRIHICLSIRCNKYAAELAICETTCKASHRLATVKPALAWRHAAPWWPRLEIFVPTTYPVWAECILIKNGKKNLFNCCDYLNKIEGHISCQPDSFCSAL